MSPAELTANITAVAEALIARWIPQGVKNLKAVFIKSPESVALPIWQTDELFVDAKDVVADATEEEKKALKEKANVGKKRKSLESGKEGAAAADEEDEAAEKPAKKSKKAKAAAAAVPEGDDGKLDKQIVERKEKLKKAKAKAKAALD